MVNIDSGEFKLDGGEAKYDTNASEIGDNEIEERRRLHSATTLVSTLDNYEHEWGIRRINGKEVCWGPNTLLGGLGADIGASGCAKKGAELGAKI
jgi:hypothetical protein